MKFLNTLSINKSFTINTSSLFALNALNFLISIIILPKLINNFGIAGWGEITFSQIIINYFIWIIDWSFPQYACKQISIYEKNNAKRRSIFTNTRTSQLILFFISSIIIILYSLIFSDNKSIYLYSILILFGNFLQSYWYLNGREKIYETAFFQLFNKLLFTLFVFTLISKGNDISIYFLYFGLSSFITGCLCTLRIKYKYNEDIKFGNIKRAIKLIKESYMLFNSSIIGNLTNSCTPLLIGNFYNLESVGLYNIADRIKNISIQIINPISNSIFPKMSKYYNRNKENGNNKFIRFVFIILLLGIFLLIILNININYIVNYFLKEQASGINTIIRILTFSFLINIIYESFVNQYLVINNLYNEINKIKLSILFSTILFGIPLIYYKGLYGAAITSIIYETIGLLYAISVFIKTKNKEILLT